MLDLGAVLFSLGVVVLLLGYARRESRGRPVCRGCGGKTRLRSINYHESICEECALKLYDALAREK